MKILYGVVGEGMGHAMRSRVIVEHLLVEGHEVEIMASGRAVDYLSNRFDGVNRVNRIHGLHIIYDDNRVKKGRTLWSNVLSGIASVPDQIGAYFELLQTFKPEAVISDFESWTYFYAKAHRLPIISIDNMQVISRCTHPPEVLDGYQTEFQLTKAFVKSKLPFCDHYIITTFFQPELRKDKTTLVPPILRPEILAATRSRGEHLLVYQTAEGNDELARTLQGTGLPCRIYGMRRSIQADEVEGNLTYRPFSEQTFIADLASARAVIAGGGFTLMGEAVYLHKPMLSVPVGGQFEQNLNARYLERAGYGRHAKDLSDPATVHTFVEAIPACEDKLAEVHQDGNRATFDALDHQLDCAAGGIY